MEFFGLFFFFHWRKILAQIPSVKQKPNGFELKNISAMSGKLISFWVRQPSESSSPEKHPAWGEEEVQGSVDTGMGAESHWGCWIIWSFLHKCEPCSTRALLTQTAWLILHPACDSLHFLPWQSFPLPPHKTSLFGMMDTFSITGFSVSGFFFSSFSCCPAYQVWTTSSALAHCLFKAWAHTQTQTHKRISKNEIHHSQ